MTELIIILAIVIIGNIYNLITSFDDYFDKSKKGHNKITKKGKVFFSVLIITIILYFFQYRQNEIENLDKKNEFLKQKNQSDSLFQIKLEESNDKIIKSFAEGLAKYGLKYDSATIKIEKLIRDSIRMNTIVNKAEPFLSLCKDKPIELKNVSKENYEFFLNICNSDAPSRNIESTIYVVSVDSINNFSLSKVFELFQSNAQLDGDSRVSQQILVPKNGGYKVSYFLMKGSWTNLTESKEYKIDQIFHYNYLTKSSGGTTALHERQIRAFLKKITDNK